MNLQNLIMFMCVISMISAIRATLIVGADTLMKKWHSRVGALCAHSMVPKFHHMTGTTLFIWLVILSSTATCDRSSNIDDSKYVTQNDITDVSEQYLFYTQTTSDTLRSSHESGGNPFLNSESFLASTNLPFTSSVSKTSTIRTSNSPSSPRNTDSGSKKFATPSDTKVADRRMTDILSVSKTNPVNQDNAWSNIPITTFFPTTLSITNPCDTDQVVVSDEPVQLYADTSATKCSLLVTTENSTSISVTLLKSDINNVYTYFYIEILENSTQMCQERYLLVSGSHTPCKVTITGNQFRFYFQNTEMTLEIQTEDVKLTTCFDVPLMEYRRCNVTSYKNETKWSQERHIFKYGYEMIFDRYYYYWKWEDLEIEVNVVQYKAMCTCDCHDTCMCTLGYREWLSTCFDSKESTTKADLVVYNPSMQGLSFVRSGMHVIQQHSFLGLKDLKVLLLSHNVLKIFPPTVCQNSPQLEILKIDNNRLANLNSDIFKGQCERQLLLLDLSNNELTHIPHELFKVVSNLKTLDLRQNRLIHLFNDSFNTLTKLNFLHLNDNSLSTLPQGVFATLGRLRTLDLSGNSISTLPHDVFASVGGLLTLDLSGNAISTLPQRMFALLFRLRTLNLSGNALSTLPQGVFVSLRVLGTLNLSGNAISTLPQDAFVLQVGLFDLDLSGNNISTLPQGVFASLRYLVILDLSGNAISTLPQDVFTSLTNFLFTLYLGGNSISTLPKDVFALLVDLSSLDISQNNISHTLTGNTFRSLSRLITLDLSHNEIKALPHDLFNSQKDLATLDLSHNKIFIIPAEVFGKLSKLKILKLQSNSLTFIDASEEIFDSLTNLKTLDVSRNHIKIFPPYLFQFTENLTSLDVSQNALEFIPVLCFANLSNLVNLNMSRNALSQLPSFNAQRLLQVLDLSDNRIRTLAPVVLITNQNLEFLSLSRNNLVEISSQMFYHLHKLAFINISHNSIAEIGSKVFSNRITYQSVDLRGNDMQQLTSHSFKSARNSTIIVDKYATCCFIHKDQCVSVEPRSEYLTCSRMLQTVFLRISIWVLGISSFICNIIAYCVRSRKKQGKKVQILLISNLATSDLLMGVNMLLLAVGDVYYGEYFPLYSNSWRHGFACKFAGFLSILSSEGSVFFITLISIDRFLGIKYPFGEHKLTTKFARFLVLMAWLVAFLIGAIPIGLAGNRGDVFSISEVCIGVPIVRRNLWTSENHSVSVNTTLVLSNLVYARQFFYTSQFFVTDVNIEPHKFIQKIPYTVTQKAGSQIAPIYSIVVFIGVNLVCFLTVAFCYIYIYS